MMMMSLLELESINELAMRMNEGVWPRRKRIPGSGFSVMLFLLFLFQIRSCESSAQKRLTESKSKIERRSSQYSSLFCPNMSSRVLHNAVEGLGSLMWKGGIIASGLVAVGLGLLYTKQESLLYFPEVGGMARSNKRNPRGYQSPSEHKIPFEEHMIPCNFHHHSVEDSGSIHSWLLLQGQDGDTNIAAQCPTLVFFHGNAGNIGHRIPNAKNYYNHLGVNVLLVEYRGYGDSSSDTDRPTERGLKNDAIAVLHYLRSLSYIDPNKIFVFGQSLGGACALYLAQYAESSNIPVAGVIVENTFLSIPKMVDVVMPYLKWVKSFVLKMNWDNEDLLTRGLRTTPILFLAGDKDELVPHHHMIQLYKLSSRGERKTSLSEFYSIKGGRHNDTWMRGGRQYYEKMNAFISNALIHRSDDGMSMDPFSSSGTSREGSMTQSLQIDKTLSTDSTIEVDMGGITESERKSSTVFSRTPDDKKKIN